MSPILLHFLATLATSADLMVRYLKDPETTMALFGLSAEDTALVLRRDAGQIESVVMQAAATVQVVYVPCPAYPSAPPYYQAMVPVAQGMQGAALASTSGYATYMTSGGIMGPGGATHLPAALVSAPMGPAPFSAMSGAASPSPAPAPPPPRPGPATHLPF